LVNKTKINILFIGNDPLTDNFLKTELEKIGYQISYKATEFDLVSSFITNYTKPDLLIFDNSIQKYENIINENIILKFDIPILFILTKPENIFIEKLENHIIYDYIVKNSPISYISEKLSSLFEKRLLLKKSSPENNDASNTVDAFALHEIICDIHGNPIDYRFIDADQKFLNRIGKNKEEIIGKTALELFPETEQTWINVFGRVALTGQPEKIIHYSKEFNNYYEARIYSPEKGKFLALFIDLKKINEK
jgi:hypothetical protein